MERKIYLDHNATTPLLPEAWEAMQPYWRVDFGNPSSLHGMGERAARAVREAREEVARLLGARDGSEVIFTSGATESNNAVFRSVSVAEGARGRVATTAVEHSSVLRIAKALQEEGRAEIVLSPVDGLGNLDPEELAGAAIEGTALVSVMMANNETGVIFPVEEIGRRIKSKGILFHVDAVQAAGKLPFSVKDSPIDFLSVSAHKLGGPKGVGALYVKHGTPFHPFLFGGSQEKGRRAGTENVPGIVGFGAAARYRRGRLVEAGNEMRKLRDYFEGEVLRTLPQVKINGDPSNRLPNTTNLAFQGVDSEALLILLDEEGVCASSGSACLSGAPEPSHVLKAMGCSDEQARGSVRFSFGEGNTYAEAGEVVRILARLVSRLRETEFEEQHPHSRV
jgi:cysteine desulfurase